MRADLSVIREMYSTAYSRCATCRAAPGRGAPLRSSAVNSMALRAVSPSGRAALSAPVTRPQNTAKAPSSTSAATMTLRRALPLGGSAYSITLGIATSHRPNPQAAQWRTDWSGRDTSQRNQNSAGHSARGSDLTNASARAEADTFRHRIPRTIAQLRDDPPGRLRRRSADSAG